ncbi:hypothetical protein F4778DRAFT_731059 [Xylariomycetidae sp. FL2044]|nr:hypothetical protein F4778DRAFT_731059 [Xylariomycetidae sp. FL2044]
MSADQLRKQLADTQDALNNKAQKYRQLRVDEQRWNSEKHTLEARLRKVEQEVLEQQRRLSEATKGPSIDEKIQIIRSDEDTVTISRSQMTRIDAKYRHLGGELEDLKSQYDALQLHCDAMKALYSTGVSPSALIPDISHDQIITLWQQLTDSVRQLSVTYFNGTLKVEDSRDKKWAELAQLSTHWISYLTTPNHPCHLFRALIWRYLSNGFLEVIGRVWGREVCQSLGKLRQRVFSKKITTAEKQDWAIHTGMILHKSCDLDTAKVTSTASSLYDGSAQFTSNPDLPGLKKAVRELALMAAQMSAIFARSRFFSVMSNEVGSKMMRGFPYDETSMVASGALGRDKLVDLMASPCLLKEENGCKVVVVKAEVFG